MTRYQPLPKPVTAVKRLRVRPKPMSAKRRKEQKLVAQVFAAIESRDGRCVIYKRVPMSVIRILGIGWCDGDSTPAHLERWRRGTCKLPASERSNRKTIVRMCQFHHQQFDQHAFSLAHGPDGADDPNIMAVAYAKGAA